MSTKIIAPDRVRGLDSIRFVCALWVFFGHGAQPRLPDLFTGHPTLALATRAIWGNLWSGPAAVIVFFVISGFCIHYPFAGSDTRPRLGEFYVRRFLRLLIPLLVALPLSGFIGVRLALFQDSILWSLIAELFYYICYPALRDTQLRLRSWMGILVVSFAVALAVAATDPRAGDYPSYGVALNWLLGLPCWLLGCMVAESCRTAAPVNVSGASIWMWRSAVFTAAWMCSFLRFHSPLGYPWTLNWFAVLAALWLYREVGYRRFVPPPRALEWAGLWSYSLYLLHVPASALLARLWPSLHDSAYGWAVTTSFVLGVCCLFYVVVEGPGHAVARQVARRLRPAPAQAGAPAG